VAATVKLQKFVISEPHFSPSKQGSNHSTIAPFETIKLVPVIHYDVSVTSQLAKNIYQLPYFVAIF